MRHRIRGRKFSRTTNQRKALLKGLGSALVQEEVIRTTLPKAKDLRPFIEKAITQGRTKTLATRRHLTKVLGDYQAVQKILDDLAPRYQDRPGGYVRIVKDGFRSGDCAPMAVVSFV